MFFYTLDNNRMAVVEADLAKRKAALKPQP